jgi:hypothetical protein
MLKTRTLIDKLGEEYAPMLRKVNIPDFTKCIAQVSGLDMNEVSDAVIEEYLTHWAVNKKRFFDLMGDIKVDVPYEYVDTDTKFGDKLKQIGKQYPAYYLWFKLFDDLKSNKIETDILSYRAEDTIRDVFDGVNVEGMTLTHFFKRYLQAPDEITTEIGKVFENTAISANFTFSIDPVDMMTASENPYGWTSCYRLERDFYECHADGCIAAILDKTSMITYVWNNEGKLNLYDNFELKNVRYKRMRMWIAVSEDMKTIHFNTIYPGKSNYSESFEKETRSIVEKFFCDKLGIRNMWKRSTSWINWYINYGYSEFNDCNMWTQSDSECQNIVVYDVPIKCPDGCGDNLIPTSGYEEDEEFRYNGEGLRRENYEECDYRHYCDYIDDYCESEDCEYCEHWNRENALCAEQLSRGTQVYCPNAQEAEDEGEEVFDPYNSREVHCGGQCEGCRFHHIEEQLERQQELIHNVDNMREEIAADLNSFNTAIYTWNWNDAGNQIIIDNHPVNTFDAWRAYTVNTNEVNSSNEDNN